MSTRAPPTPPAIAPALTDLLDAPFMEATLLWVEVGLKTLVNSSVLVVPSLVTRDDDVIVVKPCCTAFSPGVLVGEALSGVLAAVPMMVPVESTAGVGDAGVPDVAGAPEAAAAPEAAEGGAAPASAADAGAEPELLLPAAAWGTGAAEPPLDEAAPEADCALPAWAAAAGVEP